MTHSDDWNEFGLVITAIDFSLSFAVVAVDFMSNALKIIIITIKIMMIIIIKRKKKVNFAINIYTM